MNSTDSNRSIELLAQITSRSKYQLYRPELGRKETLDETVTRSRDMHLAHYKSIVDKDNTLKDEIVKAFDFVAQRKIVSSMRSMQFAGKAIEKQNARIYNCCYLPLSDALAFSEAFYLLLCGTGVGYSVQYHHINQLPKPISPSQLVTKIHFISDSIEGWADAVKTLIESYFPSTEKKVNPLICFDAAFVRKKGEIISSVHLPAPGPEALLASLEHVGKILHNIAGEKRSVKPIEAMDIMNILSESVLSGGIRRSSLICLFSPQDNEMLAAKSGNWWETSPWRSRSNNSVVLYRGTSETTLRQEFDTLWTTLSSQRTGEPGIYWTSDPTLNTGTNPCVETSLEPYQFCNLTEINASNIVSQNDFNERAKYAALIGTLQAGYSDFSYLSYRWRVATENDRLLGISLTGIANGAIHDLNETEAASIAVETNEKWADILGINKAARVTCIKPSGTTSLFLGCSSGIHAIHSPYYIRRLRLNKSEPMYNVLKEKIPQLLEDEVGNDHTGVLSLPIRFDAPGAIYRTESPIDFLERVRRYATQWIAPGHRSGVNKHNVSATVSVGEHEWDAVGEWLWNNKDHYTGIACFPQFNTFYKQTPFEECTAARFDELYTHLQDFDLKELDELLSTQGDKAIDTDEPACGGGVCEVHSL